MKGMVFTEFFELVDDKFSIEISEQLIEMSELPTGGIYTSIGTYDSQEMKTLVSNLSKLVDVPVPDLLQTFGRHLFKRFSISFPSFFENINNTLEFLPLVDSYVHMEVRKLYPEAKLPSFSCTTPEPGMMIMAYQSKRNLPDLAEGMIQGCIEYFGDSLQIKKEVIQKDPPETRFTIMPK